MAVLVVQQVRQVVLVQTVVVQVLSHHQQEWLEVMELLTLAVAVGVVTVPLGLRVVLLVGAVKVVVVPCLFGIRLRNLWLILQK